MDTFGRARDRGWITARFTHRLHLLLGRRDPHVRRPRRSDVASPSGAIGALLSLRPRRVPQAGVAGHHARRARIGTSADPSRRSESIQARVSRRSAPRVLGYARLGRVDAALGAQLNGARRASNFCGGPRGSSGRCLNRWRVRLTRSAHLAWSVRDHISWSSSFREEPPSCATLVVCAAFPPQCNAALPDSGAEPLSPQRRFLTTTDPPLSPRR